MNDCEFYLGSYIEPEQDCDSALFKVHFCQNKRKLNVSSFDLPLKELTHFSISNSHIYIANQIFSYNHGADGAVSCFRFDDKDTLTLVNQQSTLGTGTVYTCLDINKAWFFISNYVAGNIAVYPVLENKLLGLPICMHRNIGHSINKARQEGPHPHAIEVSPCNSYIAVADLGLDKILFYQFANEQGTIHLVDDLTFYCQPGSGPRHVRFHPQLNHVFYVIHEMSAHISACQIVNNRVIELGHYSLPDNGFENITGAEIHIHPNGLYLFASVREANLIVTYAVEPTSGKLSKVNSFSCNGETPLSFAISANGHFLLVGNQTSNNISLFAIEQETGNLELLAEHKIQQPIMICSG